MLCQTERCPKRVPTLPHVRSWSLAPGSFRPPGLFFCLWNPLAQCPLRGTRRVLPADRGRPRACLAGAGLLRTPQLFQGNVSGLCLRWLAARRPTSHPGPAASWGADWASCIPAGPLHRARASNNRNTKTIAVFSL